MTVGGTEIPWAYGGLQTPLSEARVVLIPVEYDLTTSYGAGARDGPRALIHASTKLEFYDDELGFAPTDIGVHTSMPIEQLATGPEAMVERVRDAVGKVLDGGKMPVLIGGDHSLSVGAFMALAERKEKVTILQFDAHADLREEYQGSRFSHGCVMARARESFPCVQVGIRSISRPEADRVRRDDLDLYPIRQLREDRDTAIARACEKIGPRVYMTIDLDVLDPSIMPATGTPEPGGLTWDEILLFVRELTRDREVIGFDLMELAPIPGQHASEFMAAKLLNKVLGITKPLGKSA